MNRSVFGPLDRLIRFIETARPSDRLLLRLAFFVVIGSAIYLAIVASQQFTTETPVAGGTLTEGVVGTPRFVNPALALTRADQDMTALVYSGLMKIEPDGSLGYDLAESIERSEDGLTYTITLRRNARFHDGTPVTARDVAFTINLIQDPELKSPLRGNWTDVVVEEVSEYELTVTLEEPYAPFIENFTLGIMPAHLWSDLPVEQIPFSQLNSEPVGSGPYQVVTASRDNSGIIDSYTLKPHQGARVKPRIQTIRVRFYPNETELQQALNQNEINATAYLSPEQVGAYTESHQLIETPLPRTFGIFFNQNRSPALRDAAVREALTVAVDRDKIIDTTLAGHGVPIVGPTARASTTLESEDDIHATTSTSSTNTAQRILEEAGWSRNDQDVWEKEIDDTPVVLSLTLRTSNTPLFASLVEVVAEQWEAIGVDVVTEQFEQSGLVQSVIRPRDFQALLFGLDMSRTQDLYPFWHSSQKDDPGLNVAQYTNLIVDEALETARREPDPAARAAAFGEAAAVITEERPAVFLFQPALVYVVDDELETTPLTQLGQPADRFANVSAWSVNRESVWPLFTGDRE